jgi:arginine utilization protein RocB
MTAECIQQLLSYCPIQGPLAVIALAPPYYPHSSLGDDPADRRMSEVASRIAARAWERHGVELVEAPFFPALSDMSYLRLRSGTDPRPVAANTPLWNVRYNVPLDVIQRLNIPFINIGPQGKDAHRFTERLYLPYSLNTVPDLIGYAVELLLHP